MTLAGLRFPNRVGLAAGLDKNGRASTASARWGFGFVEVGTVTPRRSRQPLKATHVPPARGARLINRRLQQRRAGGLLANVQARELPHARAASSGLNIGKNAATPIERAVDDYLIGLAGVYPHADYVTVNISSPNTKNLRACRATRRSTRCSAHHAAAQGGTQREHGRRCPSS